jgi:hypothetical protein
VTMYVCVYYVLYLIKSLCNSVIPILRKVYFTKFESVLKYGIIFWDGGLEDTETVFIVQKICLRVAKGVNKRVSCRSIFGELRILTGTSLYIFRFYVL